MRSASHTKPRPLFCFVLFCSGLVCSLFFPEKEKRTRKESHKPAWAVPLRPPVSGTHIPREKYFAGLLWKKPRREKQETDDGGGPPDGLRAFPSALRFLFFGSFFSFSERKERTGKAVASRNVWDGLPDSFCSFPFPPNGKRMMGEGSPGDFTQFPPC